MNRDEIPDYREVKPGIRDRPGVAGQRLRIEFRGRVVLTDFRTAAGECIELRKFRGLVSIDPRPLPDPLQAIENFTVGIRAECRGDLGIEAFRLGHVAERLDRAQIPGQLVNQLS